jgi:hypothetical protein
MSAVQNPRHEGTFASHTPDTIFKVVESRGLGLCHAGESQEIGDRKVSGRG